MARSVSTIPKTTTKPASTSVPPAAEKKAPKEDKKEKKEKEPKAAAAATTAAATTTTASDAAAPKEKAPKEKAPKEKKEKKASSKDKKEKVVAPAPAAAAAPAAAPVEAESVPEAHEDAAGQANALVSSIAEVVLMIKELEAEAKLLRAQCKGIIYASRKECNSSRKFIKSKKEAAAAAGEPPYMTAYQVLDGSVRARSKHMTNTMVQIKNKINKFASIQTENVKQARKAKKENRKRAPPIASVKPIRVHDKITTFMGVPSGTLLSRHEVFTAIREHISKNLCYFEGKGKKFVNPDAKLAPLFTEVPEDKKTSIDYFNMQRYLKDYFYKDVAATATAATAA